jgi:hypothetical protein
VFLAANDSTEIATLTMANPAAFQGAITGTATANTITQDSSATGGTIAFFKITNAAGTTIIHGSVTAGGGGGDIELNSLVVSALQVVSVTSLTYSAMA